MTLTLTDLFCGAGGSSTGATSIPGVSVKIAANHWQLAVDTHNTNHPSTDHDSVRGPHHADTLRRTMCSPRTLGADQVRALEA